MPPVLLALANLAPSILGLITKSETVEKASEVVRDVALTVTGHDTEDKALEALNSNPEMLAKFQAQVNDHAIAMYRAETERLEVVNKTYQTEITSGDKYVSRMRPTFGYIMAITWAYVMFIICRGLWNNPELLPQVMPEISSMFAFGLLVLGVYVNGRTQEKRRQPSLLGSLAKRLGAVK